MHSFLLTCSRSLFSTPCCVRIPDGNCLISIGLQLSVRITFLLHSCFAELGDPLEACIGLFARCWHCRWSSVLNNVVGERPCTFCKLANTWRGIVLTFVYDAFFGLIYALIRSQSHQKYCCKWKLPSTICICAQQVWFRRYFVFLRAYFLPLQYIRTY